MSENVQSVISADLTAIRTCLTAALPSCRVYEDYEYRRAAALSVTTLTVGVKAIRLSDRYLANTAGYRCGALVHAVAAEVDYAVTVHCPVAEGGDAGRRTQTAVADILRWSNDLAFASITGGAPVYDRIRRCLCFPLTLTARYLL